MPRTPRSEHEGAVHHVFGRGNGKQPIFRDERDFACFLARFTRYQAEHGIIVLAYCLMVNHYHFALQSMKGEISTFMKRFLSSYTRIFNDRWVSVGHVFQGRFGSRRCKTDAEVQAAIRYVHLNPVEAHLVPSPELWKWSGHAGILAGADGLVAVDAVLELFGGLPEYESFINTPTKKTERRTLDQIAQEMFGAGFRTHLADAAGLSVRRQLAVAGLAEGYRRSDLAKFLGRSAASITKLLACDGR